MNKPVSDGQRVAFAIAVGTRPRSTPLLERRHSASFPHSSAPKRGNMPSLDCAHAKVIAGMPAGQQTKFFDKVVQHGLSVRETERMAKEQRERLKSAGAPQEQLTDDLGSHYRELLEGHLGTKVEVKGGDTGEVSVHFYSEEELIRVVKKILGKEE